jgi:ribosomal protein S12 methylthiotransferase accessory factor
MEMKIEFPGGQKVNALFNGYQVKTDQSTQNGGDGTAPEPFSVFLASIGTCTGIYILRFCQERNINIENLALTLKPHWNKEIKLVDMIDIDIHTGKLFPDKYKKALLKVAKLCTVKRQLEKPPMINLKLV